MNSIISLCLLGALLTSASLFGQQSSSSEQHFIQSLANYRRHLMLKEDQSTLKMKEVLHKWRQLEPNEQLVGGIIFQLLYGQLIEQASFKANLRNLKFSCPPSPLINQMTSAELDILANNAELIDLIVFGLLSSDYPYTILPDRWFLEELDFYDLQEREVIAEIGAGNGTFSILLNILNMDLKIYVNEINPKSLKYIQHTIEKQSQQSINFDKMMLIEGSKKKTNIPEKVDKIIIRNTFHHFSKKRQMLESIAQDLKPQGHLFIKEPIPTPENPFSCSKRMSRQEIKKTLADNGFILEKEQTLGYSMYFSYRLK